MAEIISFINEWPWLIFGIIMLIAELFIVGIFLFWLGLAAIIVGLLSLFISLAWQIQWIIFAILSCCFVAINFYLLPKSKAQRAAENINKPMERHIGKIVTLSADMQNGAGRIKLGDTMWKIISESGENFQQNTKIKIIAIENNALKVQQVNG